MVSWSGRLEKKLVTSGEKITGKIGILNLGDKRKSVFARVIIG